MRIVHRVGLAASEAQRHELEAYGVQYERLSGELICFQIDEDHSAWPSVATLIDIWKAPDLVITEFTRRELARAKYLTMHPGWHFGYPQPERDFGYIRKTYDSTNYCPSCGTGGIQQAPFRMLREPKWGRRQILQLNWVLDEFFVTPEAWNAVFKPLGIEALPVLQHKTGEPLTTVLQLQISAWTTDKVNPDGYRIECCDTCKRMKLAGNRSGTFPHVELPGGVHIAKTHEYFGSNAAAWHTVVISAELYKAIAEHKFKGAEFGVVADR
jgi:hypothetical protein